MKKQFLIATLSICLILLFVTLTSENKIQVSSEPEIAAVISDQRVMQPISKVNYLKDANLENEMLRTRLVKALEQYFDKAINRKKMVGAAVGIVKCDSMIFLGGFGKRNIKSKEIVDKETVFRIGSLSKGFAGVLAGIEVEKGLMNWGDKVVDYVPNFRVKGADRTEKITLKVILSHSSGLPYHSFTNLVEEGLTLNDISSQFATLRPIAEPGKIYSYQNAIYALSGEMIAKAENKPLGTVFQDRIFNPLGMTSASTDYESLINSDNIAIPHRKRYGRWRAKPVNQKYYNAIAAGGVNASVTDMAKWMRFLLGHNQDVLSSSTLNEVFNPTVKIPGKYKYYQRWKGHTASSYGFGWRIHDYKNPITGELARMMHHGGTVSDYRSEIAIYPNEDLGICVLFNSPTRLAKTVIPELRKIVQDIMNTPVQKLPEDMPQLFASLN